MDKISPDEERKKIIEKTSRYFSKFLVVIFVLLSLGVFAFYVPMFLAYNDSRFAGTQFWRLVAFLAPYPAFLISVFVSSYLRRKRNYKASVFAPAIIILLFYFAGQAYLKTVPDPIMENFGRRDVPYPGYLVLPVDAVPQGFVEREHYYSKTQYTIGFNKMIEGKRISLDISQGPRIHFGTSGCAETEEFSYKDISGNVYACTHSKTGDKSFVLIWLNPPLQRIAIFLDQTKKEDYSEKDLIQILKSMQ
jgi:hypothetical protein